MALSHSVVVEIMSRCYLDAAGAKFQINVAVGNDRNLAIRQWQFDHLADQVLIAWVFRVHHHGRIAEHGFRTGCGNRQ